MTQDTIDRQFARLGPIAAIQQIAETMSTAFFWYDPNGAVGNRILHQGTMTFVNTGRRDIGISAAHVYRGFLEDRAANSEMLCQVGAAGFDPEAALLSIDDDLDLATFEITADLVAEAGKGIHRPSVSWPPAAPKAGERVMFGGHVGRSFRTESQVAVHSVFASFFTSVTSAADDFIKSTFNLMEATAFPNPTALLPGTELGGASGGPVLTVQEDPILAWSLSGISLQYEEQFQIAYARPVEFVSDAGSITHS